MSDAIAVWFLISVVLEIFGSLAFWLWLRRRTSVRTFWAGTPGYLEYRYFQWCKVERRTPNRVLWLRAASLVNAVAAGIALFATMR